MKINSKKNQNEILNYIKFHQIKFIISFLIILFLFLIYLSIPVIYNYNTYDQVLKNKINQDFKINIKNIKKIEYNFFPKPHFIVRDSIISLTKGNSIATIDKLYIYIDIKNLYNLDKIQIEKIILKQANLKFKFSDLISFTEHLKTKITKPIYIYDSNFFYYDENKDNILISPIKKFKYFIDYKNKKKYLKTSGILFGTSYKYDWIKDYTKPNFSESYIKFKNPNLLIHNIFENDYEQNSFQGKTNLEFLRKKISLNYLFDKNKIELFNNKENLIKSSLYGKINLNPFYYDLNLNLLNYNIESVIDKLFFHLHSIQKNVHKNINGNIKINFDQLENKISSFINFDNLIFELNFQEGKVNFKNAKLTLNKVGKINILDIKYVERDNKLFIRSKLELIIDNQNEFYKRIQIYKNKKININKVYFIVEKNIDINEYFLESIYFNKMPKLDNKKENNDSIFFEIKNFRALLEKIKKEINNINRD